MKIIENKTHTQTRDQWIEEFQATVRAATGGNPVEVPTNYRDMGGAVRLTVGTITAEWRWQSVSAADAALQALGATAPTTAGALCRLLAHVYETRGDGRSKSLAATLREIGDVLGDQHTADALRSFWALGLEADTAKAPIAVTLARKATLGELLSLCGGVPREIGEVELAGASDVGAALVEHYHAQEGPRAAAMAATFQRELDAVHACG
jgi:hypothetical protein